MPESLRLDQIAELPVALDVEAAARLLGVSPATAYRMLRTGAFPSTTLRVGNQWRIPTAPLLTALGLSTPGDDDGAEPDTAPPPGEPRSEATQD